MLRAIDRIDFDFSDIFDIVRDALVSIDGKAPLTPPRDNLFPRFLAS